MLNVESVFKSMVLEDKTRIDEGSSISFVIESTGEEKTGTVVKIAGTSKERKLQVLPVGSEYEELYSLEIIADGSLKIL